MEITPFQFQYTMKKLEENTGCKATLRPATKEEGSGPYITDNGNYISDCVFADGVDPSELEALANKMKLQTGVIEHGPYDL